MLKCYTITSGRLAEVDASGGQIFVYVNPDEAERRLLVDTWKIDEHTLASALDPDELPRLEFEPEHVAMILKRPKSYNSQDELLFRVASTGLFLFRDRLVIVLNEDVPLFEGRQFQRVASLQEVVLKVLYRSVFHFIEHLKVINAISDSLEQQINTAMENKYLFSLFTLEKSLVYYLNAINANAKLIEKLRNNASKLGFTPENLEFIDDLIVDNSQCYDQAEIYSNILSSMMDARASIVSNNLNVLMKTLTLITISIMLPTLVVSVFSMNVHIPLEAHPLAFWLILAFAGVSVATVMFLWWYKKL